MSSFYQYIGVFDWFSKVFGLTNPFPDSSGIPRRLTYRNKLWSFLILVLLVTSYALSVKKVDFNIKSNLYWICQTNEILIATASVLMNLFQGEEVRVNLYATVDIILKHLRISNQASKIFCLKLLLRILIPLSMYFVCLILEIMSKEPPFYQQVTRIPLIISCIHFLIHNRVIVAAIDAVNCKMSKKLSLMKNDEESKCLQPKGSKRGIFKYLLNSNVKFIDVEDTENVDLKIICRIYDELCTCVKLLEMHHGYQGILMIWMIFSSTVCMATLLICTQAEHTFLLALICALPFYWLFMCASLDHQMRCEVERLENLVVKFLIDFRCDQPRKSILQVLKQQITSNRLQFVACGVLCLNYSTILNTVMNIITYTIILVQVFLRAD